MKKIFLTLFCMLIAVQAFAQAAAEDNKGEAAHFLIFWHLSYSVLFLLPLI